jgi:ubiquitin-conjugating enzyme E2 R
MFRTNPEKYRSIVKNHVEASKPDRPADFVMPANETVTKEDVEKEEPDFWAESDIDSDVFGGSDSDDDPDMDQFSGSEEEDEDDETP